MEVQTKARIKLWGNSFGVVIPKEVVIKENLQENDEVIFSISKNNTLKGFFGKGKNKGLKISTQKMKDELRKEWPMN